MVKITIKKKKRIVNSVLPTKKSKLNQSIIDHILLFFGQPGVGKTYFVNGFTDRVLFLSTDRGTRGEFALRKEVNTFDELEEAIDALQSMKHEYDMVCLDHIDDICLMVENKVCENKDVEALADLPYGSGWRLFRKKLYKVISDITKTGLGIVFIAHEGIKEVTVNGIKIDKIMPDLTKGGWKAVIPLCSLVGYCVTKTVKIGKIRKQKRMLYTLATENIYAKDRTDRKKSENGVENLDSKQFVKTFN